MKFQATLRRLERAIPAPPPKELVVYWLDTDGGHEINRIPGDKLKAGTHWRSKAYRDQLVPATPHEEAGPKSRASTTPNGGLSGFSDKKNRYNKQK